MPQAHARILIHVAFSTKNRIGLLRPELEEGLYAYIHGIVENNKSKLIIGGGDTDHAHLPISLGKAISISEMVGDMKRDSSVWMKQYETLFHWQEGYGAFSIGESQVEAVVRYIQNQKQHHAK